MKLKLSNRAKEKLDKIKKPKLKIGANLKRSLAERAEPKMDSVKYYQKNDPFTQTKPFTHVVAALASFERLLESTTDEGQYKKWLQLEVSSHKAVIKRRLDAGEPYPTPEEMKALHFNTDTASIEDTVDLSNARAEA